MNAPFFHDMIGAHWEICLGDREILPVAASLANMCRSDPASLADYLDDPIRRANLLCSVSSTRDGKIATLNTEMNTFFQGNGEKVLDAVAALLTAIRQTNSADEAVLVGLVADGHAASMAEAAL